jgi:hypothetical protein
MSTRKFFTLATLSVLLALACHFITLRYAGRSAQLFRESMQRPNDAESLRVERASVSRHVYVALWSGVALAVASVGFTILSHRADESAPRSLVIMLLCFYGLLHFAAV